MSSMPKRRTVVYFNESEWEALKKMSEKTGAPVAELVRRAVAEWIAKKSPALILNELPITISLIPL
jgi:hypothetical protein